MADIFNRTITFGGVLSGETIRLTWGTNSPGMLVLRANIQAGREVNQLMDLSDGSLWWLTTIPAPVSLQLIGMVSTPATYKSFVDTFGNICSGSDLVMTVSPPQCTGTSGTDVVYTLKKAVLAQLQGLVDAGEYRFTSTVVLIGQALELSTA